MTAQAGGRFGLTENRQPWLWTCNTVLREISGLTGFKPTPSQRLFLWDFNNKSNAKGNNDATGYRPK